MREEEMQGDHPGLGRRAALTRELGRGLVLLALTGSSVGGAVSLLLLATRALGR